MEVQQVLDLNCRAQDAQWEHSWIQLETLPSAIVHPVQQEQPTMPKDPVCIQIARDVPLLTVLELPKQLPVQLAILDTPLQNIFNCINL